MGTAVRTAKTSPASWDAFADVDAFVDEVLAELAAMETDGTKPTRSGPKPTLAGAALRKAIMAIWCLCFCGLQWRAIGQLCDIPFNLHRRHPGQEAGRAGRPAESRRDRCPLSRGRAAVVKVAGTAGDRFLWRLAADLTECLLALKRAGYWIDWVVYGP
jgi:hypothetical protein